MWGWQTKTYKKGEDPIDEWKKRRASGQISDLDDQYGDPKKVGGIPLPGASFGVGGEFGVGGMWDMKFQFCSFKHLKINMITLITQVNLIMEEGSI